MAQRMRPSRPSEVVSMVDCEDYRDLPPDVVAQLSKQLQRQIRGEIQTAPQQQRVTANQKREDARAGKAHRGKARSAELCNVHVPKGRGDELRSIVQAWWREAKSD